MRKTHVLEGALAARSRLAEMLGALVLAALVLSGCGSSDEGGSEPETTPASTSTPEETTPTPSDIDPVVAEIRAQLDAFTEMGTRKLIKDTLAGGTAPEVLAATAKQQLDQGGTMVAYCVLLGLISERTDGEIIEGCYDEVAKELAAE